MVPAKPFVDLLRRVSRSGYSSIIMNNRMMMQCYDINIDSDVGSHYALYIPDTEEYSDPFYDMQIILKPKDVLGAYSNYHKQLDKDRKERGISTKESHEEFILQEKNGYGVIKFVFCLKDEVLYTSTCRVTYPVSPTDTEIMNCERTYQGLLERIKPGGACLLFDGNKIGLYNTIVNSQEIYYYIVHFHNKHVQIPFSRSTFMGITNPDVFLFSIQESNIPGIYVYSVLLEKKKISEQTFGFLLSF